MSENRAEPLSPIDAATLWPQLHRLSTEVVATRGGENLLLSAGFAATGLTRLPRVPRTAVVGVRRGLSYRGVAVARELAGGAGWEAISLRIARDKDDDSVTRLLAGASIEVARRGGRSVYLRFPEGSAHETAVRRAGFVPYREERVYALPHAPAPAESPGMFRPLTRSDRAGVFRLYCRSVPHHIRQYEAPTQVEWRSVLDSFDCEREFVVEGDKGLVAWAGFGDRECRVMLERDSEGVTEACLDLVEAQAARPGTLVIAEEQSALEHNALERGYTHLGVRWMCVRRLAVLNSLKEVVAVPAESLALPQ